MPAYFWVQTDRKGKPGIKNTNSDNYFCNHRKILLMNMCKIQNLTNLLVITKNTTDQYNEDKELCS